IRRIERVHLLAGQINGTQRTRRRKVNPLQRCPLRPLWSSAMTSAREQSKGQDAHARAIDRGQRQATPAGEYSNTHSLKKRNPASAQPQADVLIRLSKTLACR